MTASATGTGVTLFTASATGRDVCGPPSGDTTFDDTCYIPDLKYGNPPGIQWFGYQTWPMECPAAYYHTSNAQAGGSSPARRPSADGGHVKSPASWPVLGSGH